jgi:cation diffusion facilitator CzcD-associated flavoprotein CzcO
MDFKGLKYLVVGAGFFGSVNAERIAAELDERVVVIDKRDHPVEIWRHNMDYSPFRGLPGRRGCGSLAVKLLTFSTKSSFPTGLPILEESRNLFESSSSSDDK